MTILLNFIPVIILTVLNISVNEVMHLDLWCYAW